MKKRTISVLVLILLIGWFIKIWIEDSREFIEIRLGNLRTHAITITKLQYRSLSDRKINFVKKPEEYVTDAIFKEATYDPHDPNFILEFTDSATNKSYKYEFTMINNWYFETCAYTIAIEENGLFIRGCKPSSLKDFGSN